MNEAHPDHRRRAKEPYREVHSTAQHELIHSETCENPPSLNEWLNCWKSRSTWTLQPDKIQCADSPLSTDGTFLTS